MTTANPAAMPRVNLRNPQHLLAFGAGAGLSGWAPGTMGTLIAVPLALLLSILPVMAYWVVVAVLFFVGIAVCGRAAAELGQEDPPAVVFDEIVGFLVAMAAAPAGWIWVITGFLVFRLFDIYKPWPVSLVKNMRGGFGIMIDDLIAGAMTFIVIQTLWMMVEASLRGTGHH